MILVYSAELQFYIGGCGGVSPEAVYERLRRQLNVCTFQSSVLLYLSDFERSRDGFGSYHLGIGGVLLA